VTDGIMLPPDGGLHIDGGGIHAVLKASMTDAAYAATFVVTVPPGYDVGAHVHARSQEMFFVIEGRLNVLGFEPKDRSVPDWHDWEAPSGRTSSAAARARSCSSRRTPRTPSPTPPTRTR
jgi:hypothetical protein